MDAVGNVSAPAIGGLQGRNPQYGALESDAREAQAACNLGPRSVRPAQPLADHRELRGRSISTCPWLSWPRNEAFTYIVRNWHRGLRSLGQKRPFPNPSLDRRNANKSTVRCHGAPKDTTRRIARSRQKRAAHDVGHGEDWAEAAQLLADHGVIEIWQPQS